MTDELPIRWFSATTHRYFRADPPVDAIEIDAERVAWVMAEKQNGNTPRYENGAWKSYSPTAPPTDVVIRNLRRERDRLLRESDFSQMPDVEMKPDQKQAWRQYRKALRDVPSTYQHGQPVQWPQKPE